MQVHKSLKTVKQSAQQAARRKDELSLPLCSHSRSLYQLDVTTSKCRVTCTANRSQDHGRSSYGTFPSYHPDHSHSRLVYVVPTATKQPWRVPVLRPCRQSDVDLQPSKMAGVLETKRKVTCAELGRVLVLHSTGNTSFM